MNTDKKVLLTGATGYLGGKLLPKLEERGLSVRCLARSPEDLRKRVGKKTEVVEGDVLDPDSLEGTLDGVHTAYYLIHLMGSNRDFAQKDRKAALNFVTAARKAGVEKIIYMSGLGVDGSDLSVHLESRHEVGRILRDSGICTIEFRAAAIIGNGSLSFEMVKSLTERLPVMVWPAWLKTPTQPIAADDIINYLLEALDTSYDDSKVYEVGCPEVVTYGALMKEYARQRGLRRITFDVPLLTPTLSSYWLGLVTPSSATVGRHLVESLKNPTVIHDHSAEQEFKVRPVSMKEAIQAALAEKC